MHEVLRNIIQSELFAQVKDSIDEMHVIFDGFLNILLLKPEYPPKFSFTLR